MPRTVGEEVSIASVQFTERELPLWATEKTHAQILKSLQTGNKVNTAALKNIDQNIATLIGAVNVSEQIDAINNLAGIIEEGNDEDREEGEETRRTLGGLSKHFEAVSREIKDFLDPTFLDFRLPDISRIISALGTSAAFAIKNILPFGKFILSFIGLSGVLFNRISRTNETFRGLIEFGVDFNSVLDTGGDRLVSFGQAAADSTLTTKEFSSVLINFSRVAARIGERNFGVLAREVTDTLRPLGMLGLQVDEVAEFTGNYLERQRLLGTLQLHQHQNQVLATAENIKTLTAFAKVTGVARKQMEQAATAAMTQESFIAFLNTLPPEIRANMEKSVNAAVTGISAVFGDRADAIVNPLLDVMRRGAFATEDAIGMLRALPGRVGPAFTEFANTIKNSGGNVDLVNEGLVSFVDSLSHMTDVEFDFLMKQIDNSGDQFAKSLVHAAATVRSFGGDTGELQERIRAANEERKREEARMKDLNAGMELWSDTLRRLRMIGDDIFFKFLGLSGVTAGVRGALDFLEGSVDSAVIFLSGLADKTFPAIQKAMDNVPIWFETLKEKVKVVQGKLGELVDWFKTFNTEEGFQLGAMIRNIGERIAPVVGDAISFIFTKIMELAGKSLDAIWESIKAAPLQALKATVTGTAELSQMIGEAIVGVIKKGVTPAQGPAAEDGFISVPGVPNPATEVFRDRGDLPGLHLIPGLMEELATDRVPYTSRIQEPKPTPVTIVTNEEKEENNPNNEQSRSNFEGPRRPLNNNMSPIRSAEELLQETTELLRATLELGVRQTKIMEDTKNQMRNLQQGLY